MAAQQGKAVAVVVRLSDQTALLSIIVPVLNEEKTIASFLKQPALNCQGVELIVVDGGSDDQTIKQIHQTNRSNLKLIESEPGRARQMNEGAKSASGQVLLYLHADTYLPPNTYELMKLFSRTQASWGRFDLAFDDNSVAFRVISWFINRRSRLSGIATGDQALFVESSCFREVGGFPDQSLMEDVELSKRLKDYSRPYCLKERVQTSARKWRNDGVVKTILLMWQLRLAYFLGADPDELVQKYYSR